MKYKIHWSYGTHGTQQWGGGEAEIEADSPEAAVAALKAELSTKQWVQPFNEALFEIGSVHVMIGNLLRSQVIEALKTLDVKQLRELLDEVTTS